MQIYYDLVTIPYGDSSYSAIAAQNIFTVISKYDDRFTYTEGNDYITVDNSFNITFETSSESSVNGLIIDGITSMPAGTFTVTIIITNTIFYFLFKTNDDANTPVGGFCWIKEQNINYFGVNSKGSNVGQIDLMNFSDKTNIPENRYYKIKRHAQFSLISQSILFVPISIIADNGGNYKLLSELRSCSTVTFNTMISINHINYYAIGTNTLIRDDGDF